MVTLLKVSRTSKPNGVAGAIAHCLRDQEKVKVRAIGAIAVNQALKAMIVARSFLDAEGLDILIRPEMKDLQVGGEERTAVQFTLYRTEQEVLHAAVDSVFGGRDGSALLAEAEEAT